MVNDRIVGGGILLVSIVGIIVYAWLLVYHWVDTLRVSAFLAVALLLGILAWIGYTMATTPPPEPITEIPEMPSQPKTTPSGPAEPEQKNP